MGNILMYTGLGIMLLGAIFGFFVAVKGYKETDRSGVKKISLWAGFQRGPMNPAMKRLTKIWGVIMFAGLVIVFTGIAIGLK